MLGGPLGLALGEPMSRNAGIGYTQDIDIGIDVHFSKIIGVGKFVSIATDATVSCLKGTGKFISSAIDIVCDTQKGVGKGVSLLINATASVTSRVAFVIQFSIGVKVTAIFAAIRRPFLKRFRMSIKRGRLPS